MARFELAGAFVYYFLSFVSFVSFVTCHREASKTGMGRLQHGNRFGVRGQTAGAYTTCRPAAGHFAFVVSYRYHLYIVRMLGLIGVIQACRGEGGGTFKSGEDSIYSSH
jgi:hypothetical protein